MPPMMMAAIQPMPASSMSYPHFLNLRLVTQQNVPKFPRNFQAVQDVLFFALKCLYSCLRFRLS